MNRVIKEAAAALIKSKANPFDLRVALFHSTPVLHRKRRTHWESDRSTYKRSPRKSNYYYSRRYRKLDAKEELLCNVGAFAERLFEDWHYDDDDEHEPSSSRRSSSWFRRNYGGKSHKGWRAKAGDRRTFGFCDDDDDFEVETIFRSSFGGGNGYFFWSFVDEEQPRRSSSRGYNQKHRSSWSWRHHKEDEYGSSEDSDSEEPDLTSDRLALGLSGSGPLSLEDVKNAYRACAMKWHPDRHDGCSKAVAEEKFKTCSAAYQSLCDKMALN